MWPADALLDGFRTPVAVAPVAAFRVLFATACLVKFAVETRRGHHRYLDDGAYVAVIRRARGARPPLTARSYRTLYAAKVVAAALLLLGLAPQVAAALLAAWFLLECTVLFKFHTSYFALLAAGLAISPGAGRAFTIHTLLDGAEGLDAGFAATADGLGPALVVVTTMTLYLGSAVRKLRSPAFVSGRALRAAVRYTVEARGRRHAEAWYPDWLARWSAGDGETDRQPWDLAAKTTIAAEVALPILLLLGGWWTLAGVSLGVAMHAAFTFMLPVTLAHFSLATVSTYLLFLPPDRTTELLHALLR